MRAGTSPAPTSGSDSKSPRQMWGRPLRPPAPPVPTNAAFLSRSTRAGASPAPTSGSDLNRHGKCRGGPCGRPHRRSRRTRRFFAAQCGRGRAPPLHPEATRNRHGKCRGGPCGRPHPPAPTNAAFLYRSTRAGTHRAPEGRDKRRVRPALTPAPTFGRLRGGKTGRTGGKKRAALDAPPVSIDAKLAGTPHAAHIRQLVNAPGGRGEQFLTKLFRSNSSLDSEATARTSSTSRPARRGFFPSCRCG